MWHIEQLRTIAEVTPLVESVIASFWPGPLTLILKKKPCVPDTITAGQPTVAVRCTYEYLFREVLKGIGEPLVAPSANKFHHLSPTTAEHVYQELGRDIPYILDAGDCTYAMDSTILSLVDEEHPTLLRPGPVFQETLELFFRHPIATDTHTAPPQKNANGTQRYVTQTPLYVVDHLEGYTPPPNYEAAFNDCAVHVFFYKPERRLAENERFLSDDIGNVIRGTACFYDRLRFLDRDRWKSIWMEKAPDSGFGIAMNDRLVRAAHVDLSSGQPIVRPVYGDDPTQFFENNGCPQ